MVSKIIQKGYMMFLVSQLVFLLFGIVFCSIKLITSVAECVVAVTKAYVKTSLEFVRAMSPLVSTGEAQSDMQFLYSEIFRMNPKLIAQRLGNELIFKKTFK